MTAQLDEKLDALAAAGVRAELLGRLRRYVAEEPAPRLFHISPYRLAEEWGLSPKDALDAFLLGTRQGLFDLEWSIRCRSCFGPADSRSALSALKSSARCASCRIDIRDASLDADVEVNFKVGRAVRPVDFPPVEDMLAAWLKLDVLDEATIPPGQDWVRETDLAAGAYKVFTDGFKARASFLIEGDGAPAEPEIAFAGSDDGFEWRSGVRPPGRYAIRVRNAAARPLRVLLARAAETPWVSGLDVASNQHFRDMFSQELVAADESFGVKNVVLLFTDIRGSTNLYERRGDARAYALVKEHFRILFEAVRRHNGALVKTIGDAVMASFLTPHDAMAAILDAHDRFDAFNRGRPADGAIVIKAGLHGGACIAVTLNDALDYFGRMVNLAARVQGESAGGDIVVSRELYDRAGVAAQAAAAGWSAAFSAASLKGIEDPIALATLTRRA